MRELKLVAVIIETSTSYGRGLLRGISRFHREQRAWSVYFKPFSLNEALPTWVTSWKGDGILARVPNAEIGKKLLECRLPMIDLRGGALSIGLPPFGADNQAIAEAAYSHLSDCGLENFAFIGEPRNRFYYDDERCSAFADLVAKHGRKCFVFNHFMHRSDNGWESHVQQLMGWLEKLPKPVGVLCCHDDRGQQVLDACQRAGLGVPDEIAVLGVDNDEYLCGFSIPSLSSIDINSERIGYEAARLLDLIMHGQHQFDQPKFFTPRGVVVRQSTEVFACEDAKVAAAIRLIRQHACNCLTVKDLLKSVGMSRSAFHERFKRVVGRSPKQEILRMQLKHAKMLLQSTDKPVYEVAKQVGFEEAKYFITVFHNSIGMTPKNYRLHTRQIGESSDQ